MTLETSTTQLHGAAHVRRVISTRRDAGVSMVEILVSIVLIGMVVVAALLTLQTTIIAGSTDRDHANAFAWLQSASDAIYRAPRVSCETGRPNVINQYDLVAKAADRPVVWPTSNTQAKIRVYNVEFLGRTNPDAIFEWDASFCFEGASFATSPLYTQRVSIEVTTPDGMIKTLQMVKSEG